MDVRVDDKVAIVTGASRGIGEAIAAEMLASGARGVTITSRKEPNLAEAVERLPESQREAVRLHYLEGLSIRAIGTTKYL